MLNFKKKKQNVCILLLPSFPHYFPSPIAISPFSPLFLFPLFTLFSLPFFPPPFPSFFYISYFPALFPALFIYPFFFSPIPSPNSLPPKHSPATIFRHWNWNWEEKVAGTEGCKRVGEEGQGIQTARPAAGGSNGPHQHAQQASPRSLTLPHSKPDKNPLPPLLATKQLTRVLQVTITQL